MTATSERNWMSLHALATAHLPTYFRDAHMGHGPGPTTIDWNAVLTNERTSRTRMLSTGELCLLGILADAEDRPGAVKHIDDMLLREHNAFSITFTGKLKHLDESLRVDVLGGLVAHWLPATATT